MLKRNVMRVLLGCAGLFGAQGMAWATPISCSLGAYDVSNKVAGASNCERLAARSGNGLNDSDTLVNTEAFFGIDTWVREGKYDNMGTSGGQDASKLFNFSGNSLSGSFSYVGSTSQPMDVMLVFKSGNKTNLVAYLLEDPFLTGSKYSSPFISGLFDIKNTKNISHISVYTSVRTDTDGGGNKVSEPAGLALLSIGAAGFLLRRRRSRVPA